MYVLFFPRFFDDSDHVGDLTYREEDAGRHKESPLRSHVHKLKDVVCEEIGCGGSTHGVEEIGCQGGTDKEPPRLVPEQELEVPAH